MLIHLNSTNIQEHAEHADRMFLDRKRVFVDILKWNVPTDGRHERDQYDDEHAEYVVIADQRTGEHCGSMRILRTDRPHILGQLFPDLCDDEVPTGNEYRELTRLCLSPRLRAAERLRVRNRLFTSLVQYGLLNGIKGYTGVAEMGWYSQLLRLGWRCTPLGLPRQKSGELLAAVLAHIEPHTIDLFREAGTYDSGEMSYVDALSKAA